MNSAFTTQKSNYFIFPGTLAYVTITSPAPVRVRGSVYVQYQDNNFRDLGPEILATRINRPNAPASETSVSFTGPTDLTTRYGRIRCTSVSQFPQHVLSTSMAVASVNGGSASYRAHTTAADEGGNRFEIAVDQSAEASTVVPENSVPVKTVIAITVPIGGVLLGSMIFCWCWNRRSNPNQGDAASTSV